MALIHNVEENSDANWDYLPANVLDEVLCKLISFADFVRFAAVCKPWFNVAIENKKKMISSSSSHKQIPMLIVPSSDKNTTERSLYDITKNRYYNFSLNLSYAKRFCGSSHGWLAIVEENSVITLINPFTSGANSIRLPRLDEFVNREIDEYDVNKLILSANPLENDDYMVAIIPTYYCCLAVIKRGDKDWTYFEDQRGLHDVTYYKDKFYATNEEGDVIVSLGLDDDGSFMRSPQLISAEPIENFDFNPFRINTYILESSSSTRDLLLVHRCIVAEDEESHKFKTSDFKVAKFKNSSPPAWIEIDDLGDQAIFLGDNHSFSVVASEFHGAIQPNSIYYTDFNYIRSYNPPDMGVFNLEKKSFNTHYIPNPSNNKLPPPIWIAPTLQGKFGVPFASFFVE